MSKYVRNFYDSAAEREWDRLDAGLSRIEFASTLRLIEKYFPANGAVCDIGSGPGRYSIELAKRGYPVTLFDLSTKLLERAERAFKTEGLRAERFVQGDARDLGVFDDESFDSFRVASWNAAGPKTRRRSLGGPLQTARFHCPNCLYALRRHDCAVTRLYQKRSENVRQRSQSGTVQDQDVTGGAMSEHIGSNFDEFLEEEGLLSESEATAAKRVIAYQLSQFMEENKLSKSEMARRMQTSRSALDRLLDASNSSVTLRTLDRAAQALGRQLRIALI